jgi:hypothetical protein
MTTRETTAIFLFMFVSPFILLLFFHWAFVNCEFGTIPGFPGMPWFPCAVPATVHSRRVFCAAAEAVILS